MSEYEIEISGDGMLSGGMALEAVTRGEIDIQIATAKRFPRSVTAFLRTAEELATRDEETAGSMFYNLPRDGKRIEGPSVRLAEVVAYSWGNLRVESRILSIDEQFITAVGTAFDLERNLASRQEVKRRITNKNGKRFNDDMIVTTSNAACSIAMREAVFKVVPRALVKSVFDKAKDASLGKSLTMAQRRSNAFSWFEKQGITAERILTSLGRRGPEEVTVEDLYTLAGTKTAIKDGELSIDQAFPVPGEVQPSERAAAAEDRLKETAAARKSAAVEPTPAQTYPELDDAGLTGQAAPAAEGAEGDEGDEQVPLSDDQSAFIALVLDTSKGTGRLPLADETQRNRLREVANVLTAGGEVKAGDHLLSLAGDAKLGKAQAFGLLSKAIAADLLEETASDNQAPAAAPAAAEPGTLL